MEVFRLETTNTNRKLFLQWIYEQRRDGLGLTYEQHMARLELTGALDDDSLGLISGPLGDRTRQHAGWLAWDAYLTTHAVPKKGYESTTFQSLGVVLQLVVDDSNTRDFEIVGLQPDLPALPDDQQALVLPAVREFARRVEAAIRLKFKIEPEPVADRPGAGRMGRNSLTENEIVDRLAWRLWADKKMCEDPKLTLAGALKELQACGCPLNYKKIQADVNHRLALASAETKAAAAARMEKLKEIEKEKKKIT